MAENKGAIFNLKSFSTSSSILSATRGLGGRLIIDQNQISLNGMGKEWSIQKSELISVAQSGFTCIIKSKDRQMTLIGADPKSIIQNLKDFNYKFDLEENSIVPLLPQLALFIAGLMI